MADKPVMTKIEVPQYYIMTDENLGTLNLVFATSGTMYQTFLCMDKDYRKVAAQFREMIMRAGAELTAKTSKLVVAKGLPDGLRPPQGRK